MDREQVRRVVERATMAPSLHNSQPWRFVAGAHALDLYADRTRAVPVLDPAGRQLVISCGAALQHARLAVRAEGRDYHLETLPDPADPDHLARVRIAGPRPPTPDELALVCAMASRHTHREPFDDRPVPGDLLDELRLGVATEGAWLHPVELAEDLVNAAVLTSRADISERLDPAYVAELQSWRRGNDPHATDGLPSWALPSIPATRRHSTVPLRDFTPDAGQPEPAGSDVPVEKPLVVVLGTDTDDRSAWLDAGQALGWLLLRAAAADLMASPLNQALDLPATRRLFGGALRLVGHPQMVLRMGYGAGHPHTPRRPVDAVLTVSEGRQP